MLNEEVALYTKLTGKDGQNTPICVIGAYLDGYEKGKEEKQTNTAEWITYPYNEVKCSNCDYDLWGNLISAKDEFKYCPNCGSRMKGENQ